jgi:cytoskeletal protein CcmA (bactofilin family)
MFRNEPQPSSDARIDRDRFRAPHEERRVAAWIGASIVVRGDVSSSEDMTIAGHVEGDVSAPEHAVIVASSARIRGNIVARAIAVHGEVRGAITGSARVEVGETGNVEGDIVAPRMALHEGAVLRGHLGVRVPDAPPRPGVQ